MTSPAPLEQPGQPTRHAFAVRLPSENRERYLELHRAVPAPIEAMIRAANIRNYSIYVCGDLLFAYYEYVGTDHAADLALMAADPATQAWWLDTAPLQERLPGTPDGEQWLSLEEAWHLSDDGAARPQHDPRADDTAGQPVTQLEQAQEVADARWVPDAATPQ